MPVSLENTNNKDYYPDWLKSNSKVFWGEIAPFEHVCHIYETDSIFLDLLVGFVSEGFKSNDCVVIIATEIHLQLLNDRLRSCGFNLVSLIKDELYIPLNAEKTLSKFMVNDWPDEALFMDLMIGIIGKARKSGKHVRAFGEMVAILWAQGHKRATVHLEQLWNTYIQNDPFSLFCAYPKSGFNDDMAMSLKNICECHSKIINGWSNSSEDIFYKDLKQG